MGKTAKEAQVLLDEAENLRSQAAELDREATRLHNKAMEIVRVAMTPLQWALIAKGPGSARSEIEWIDPNAQGRDPEVPPPLALAFRNWGVQRENIIPLLKSGADPFGPGVEEEIARLGGLEWLRKFDRIGKAFDEAMRKFDRKLIGSASLPGRPGKKRETL